MGKKRRLTELLVEKGLAPDSDRARALIMSGTVMVNRVVVDKGGTDVDPDSTIELKARREYVSRGALKLKGALATFAVNPSGRICADVGAATGGFTEILLEGGAARVYTIDVGYGDLDWKLRSDSRVVTMDRTNARYLEKLPELASLVVIDVSFISLAHIFPAVRGWIANDAEVIALVKPQFEADQSQVGDGGIVRDRETHRVVLEKTIAEAQRGKFEVRGLASSPIQGGSGNHEFFIYLTPGEQQLNAEQSAMLVGAALKSLERVEAGE